MTAKLCITGLLALIAGLAQGQTQRSGSGSDTTRVVQQLQQVTAQNSKLQQDNDALKKELEAMKAKYSQANTEQIKLQQRARELELVSKKQPANTSGNDEALEKSRMQLTELVAKFRETAQALKEVEAERDRERVGNATRERELGACIDKNAQMYLLSDEILVKLEQQGPWSTLKRKEPFTQLSRTRMENMVDEYRYRIDELKLGKKNVSAASP